MHFVVSTLTVHFCKLTFYVVFLDQVLLSELLQNQSWVLLVGGVVKCNGPV
jgi:hypothetical protein